MKSGSFRLLNLIDISDCIFIYSIEVEDENGDVQDETADMVYEMLKKNFERAYNGRTRAPLGFYTHAAWWASEELEHRFEGFK